MKMPYLLSLLSLLALLTACQPHHDQCDEVICETVHRYGVPLDPQDWAARGQYGQVVSIRKDGVTVTRNYEGGILNGVCTYTFPHREVIQKKEVYQQGTLVQELFYYPHGLPQRQVSYETPAHQYIVVWYENGAPQCREEMEEGRLIHGEYYNVDCQQEASVEDAKGMRICRDGLGQLQSVDQIEEGQMVLRTTYHPNGNPAAVTPYVNGAIEGQLCTYLPGGEPATVENWVQNAQHGMTTLFEHGEKWAEVPYVKGQKQGVEKRYRAGKTIAQEVNWVQGYQHGPTYSYFGNTCQTDWYFRGRRVPNKATFDMLSNQ